MADGRRRCRRGQRGRAAPRPRRRHPGRADRVLGRRQVRARAAPRAGRGPRPDQCRERRGAGDAGGPGGGDAGGRRGSRCGSIRTWTPAPTTRSAPGARATSSASRAADIPALYARAAALPGIAPVGLAVHIGSQVLATAPYRAAFARMAELVRALRARRPCGRRCWIAAAASAFPTATSRPPARPRWPARCGRRSAASACGCWSSRGAGWSGRRGCCWRPCCWSSRRRGRRSWCWTRRMNELLRPAMYDAWHGIVPLDRRPRRRAPAPPPTSSGRCARAPTRSRDAGCCRRCAPAISWRFWTPARMVR